MVVHAKGILLLFAHLALPVLGGCPTSASLSELPISIPSEVQSTQTTALASGPDGGGLHVGTVSISSKQPSLAPGNEHDPTTASGATATTIFPSSDDQLPPLMPADTDSVSSDGHDITTSSTTSHDGPDMHGTTTSSDALAMHATTASSRDALEIHATTASSSDPLKIHTSTSKTAASGTSKSHTSAQTGASPSSGVADDSEAALMAALRPCSNSTSGHSDCRIAMKHKCSRARLQFPTCVDGACLCMAAPCANDGECNDYNNCLVDEQAKCTKDTKLYPHMQGVCTCRPRFEGCMKEAEPQEFCESRLNCTERHRELYPQSALCVAQDENEAFPHGRCLCKAVNCVVSGHQERDEAACKGLVECRETDRKTPVCLGKYGAREFPDEGYCSCH